MPIVILEFEFTLLLFLIFPGTGKSTTVVEIIAQLVLRLPDVSVQLSERDRILVCASSNSATDLLVEKLAPILGSTEMLRLMSYQRDPTLVSKTVRPYCHHDGEGFTIPSASKLLSYKVIVATCAMAGKMYNAGIKKHSFGTVIVDEAGHPEETAVYQAISWMLHPTGLLVLAGDPMQLGPVTYSDSALSVSILERLLASGIYTRNNEVHTTTGGYDPTCLTKLIYSYRCHPAILRVPNQLFYSNELVEVAWGDKLSQWDQLPTRNFPVIFHGVNGTHARESNSPSWFNVDEIEVLDKYLDILLAKAPLLSIGLIAPYQKQVSKIRQMVKMKKGSADNIKVGSCEQFQGCECDIIIITTVRSTTGLPEIGDNIHQLGFVSMPKRLNVAVTRAKSLLIIIGNPDVLTNDSNWKAMLDHCRAHNSCIGYGGFENTPDEFDDFDFFPPDVDEPSEL